MPGKSAYLFFPCSRDAERRLDELFDFVWPTAIAMWNLRWQLKGYISEHPDATHVEIASRFMSSERINPPHKLNYANLAKAQATPWEGQTRQLATVVLTSAFAVYEAFLEDLCQYLALTRDDRDNLQFPTSNPDGTQRVRSYATVFSQIALAPSPVLTSELYPGLQASRKNNLANVEAMMVCYRCFKEIRNSLVHSGGNISANYKVEAINTFVRTFSPQQLGIKQMTLPNTVSLGDVVKLELPSTVGFTAVLRNLIATLDAEFSKHVLAEDILVNQWQARFGGNIRLRRDPARRTAQLRSRLHAMGLPGQYAGLGLDTLLQQKGAYQLEL